MRRLLSFSLILGIIVVLICGCARIDEQETIVGFREQDMYRALQIAWPQYVANSASCHNAKGLSMHDEACRRAFDSLRECGYEPEWIYRLTNWFLLEARDPICGKMKYFKLGQKPLDRSVVCKAFCLQEKNWMNISRYASPLRFAPIVADTTIGFVEMWDSQSDLIARVPNGFHGLIQAGSGIFLLRKDADGEYYRWNALSKDEPKLWKYKFPEGCNVRTSFFIALSSETGRSYAFAAGLEPIPNSEGAMAISPYGVYRGRHFYGIWKGASRRYYAWPETDRSEPLSNGTETFDGCPVAYRNGKLVVLSPKGAVDVFDAKH